MAVGVLEAVVMVGVWKEEADKVRIVFFVQNDYRLVSQDLPVTA